MTIGYNKQVMDGYENRVNMQGIDWYGNRVHCFEGYGNRVQHAGY